MMPLFRSAPVAAALALLLSCGAYGQVADDASSTTADGPLARPAVDAIIDAFETHPLVGISDWHGLAQEMELYNALVRDPRFARDVGNVVVEFGGATHQGIIDSYVNGDDVPYTELRKVWTDVVGWTPAVTHLGYAHFFAQVRETNLALPPEQRIRVWLGEPPVDWTTIETREQFNALLRTRDSHPARVIIENVLTKDQKALVIYGGGHFHAMSGEEAALRAAWAESDPEADTTRLVTLRAFVEAEYPGAFFVVQTYVRFDDQACTESFEHMFEAGPTPALVAPVQGGVLEQDIRACRTAVRRSGSPFGPNMPQALQDLLLARSDDRLLSGDAILFLGPSSSLTRSPMFPDLYLDMEYRAELSRRSEIVLGQPLPPVRVQDAPLVARPY